MEFKKWQFCFGVLVISSWDLDAQQGLFKLTMKSNAYQMMAEVVVLVVDKVNPCCESFDSFVKCDQCFSSLVPYLPKYLKIVEIAMMHVLGSIKDGPCFSSILILKSKL